jgi:hypothetical protein
VIGSILDPTKTEPVMLATETGINNEVRDQQPANTLPSTGVNFDGD